VTLRKKVKEMLKTVGGMLCLAVCTVAHAGTITYLELDGNFSSPTYEFYSYTSTTGQAEDNIPVDPYITFLTGGSYNDTQVYTFCFDFNAPTTVGELYAGTLETFSDPSDLEATYLINELNAAGLTNASPAIRGAISTAIWQIMNPSSTTSLNPFPDDPAAQPWITQAETAVANGWWTATDASAYPIWIPQNSQLQRFGIVLPGEAPVPLPEPRSLIAVGVGILALVIWRRRVTRSLV
jgi:hypothetical protein